MNKNHTMIKYSSKQWLYDISNIFKVISIIIFALCIIVALYDCSIGAYQEMIEIVCSCVIMGFVFSAIGAHMRGMFDIIVYIENKEKEEIEK